RVHGSGHAPDVLPRRRRDGQLAERRTVVEIPRRQPLRRHLHAGAVAGRGVGYARRRRQPVETAAAARCRAEGADDRDPAVAEQPADYFLRQMTRMDAYHASRGTPWSSDRSDAYSASE